MGSDDESAEDESGSRDGNPSVPNGGAPQCGTYTSCVEWTESSLDDGEFRAFFDSTTVSAEVAIPCAIAEVAGSDPLEIEPLGSAVDTDALDRLLHPRPSRFSDVTVSFTVSGYEVDVTSYGRLSVRPVADAEAGEHD